MAAYILKRLLQAIPTFLGITFLSFFMIRSTESVTAFCVATWDNRSCNDSPFSI